MNKTILEKIVNKRKISIKKSSDEIPLDFLQKKSQKMPKIFSLIEKIYNSNKPALIAEMKRASPSAGVLDANLNPSKKAKLYCDAGASALSVLTEKDYFNGDIKDLKFAAEKAHKYFIPVLRKDFIIDEYQIYEARCAGADAILLIIAILDEKSYKFFYRLSHDLGMDVLVEVFDEPELELAMKLSPRLIGINNRNLKTLKTDLSVFESLSKQIPKSCLKVAESGMKNSEDVKLMYEMGADAVLVGEALMKSRSPFDLTSKISNINLGKNHDQD